MARYYPSDVSRRSEPKSTEPTAEAGIPPGPMACFISHRVPSTRPERAYGGFFFPFPFLLAVRNDGVGARASPSPTTHAGAADAIHVGLFDFVTAGARGGRRQRWPDVRFSYDE